MNQETMRIGEVAGAAGVNIQTLRYYERRGLLPHPKRNAGGQREYPSATVRLIHFIKRSQDLGFTLTEVENFSAFASSPGADGAMSSSLPRPKYETSTTRFGICDACARRSMCCSNHAPVPGETLSVRSSKHSMSHVDEG